jgi:hypothetical protein
MRERLSSRNSKAQRGAEILGYAAFLLDFREDHKIIGVLHNDERHKL